MIRKLNYTGRKRIPRSRISISIVSNPGEAPHFDASLNIEGLRLPGHAEIFVEAYRRFFFKRFSFGLVGSPRVPNDRSLDGQDPKALVMFRVKIVDRRAKGRIIAGADRIVPRREIEEPTGKASILPVDFVDLEGSVWRLDIDSDPPILQLNAGIDEIREMARSNENFMALVYPEVVRQVLRRIIVEEDHTDPETDPEDWMSQWLIFATNVLASKDLPPSGESEPVRQDKLRWIDDVVTVFSRNNKMLERFIRTISDGER